MKKNIIMLSLLFVTFFINVVLVQAGTCDYTFNNLETYPISWDGGRYIYSSSNKVIDPANEYFHIQVDYSMDYGVQSTPSDDKLNIEVNCLSKTGEQYNCQVDTSDSDLLVKKQLDGIGASKAYEKLKTCPAFMFVIYYKTVDTTTYAWPWYRYFILNVAFDHKSLGLDSEVLFSDLTSVYDTFTFTASDPTHYYTLIEKRNSDPKGTTTCEYSLASVPNSEVKISGDKYTASTHVNTVAKTDSKLIMEVNNNYVAKEQNIKFKFSSDNTYSMDYLNSDSGIGSFSIIKDTTNVFGAYGQLNLDKAKQCPDLSILYYKYKYTDKYGIVNIGFKNSDKDQENLNALATVFEGGGKINNPEFIAIGTIKKYDKETNSYDYATSHSAKYCEENPNDAYCNVISKFTGGKDLDKSTFTFCYSRGVLKTFRVAHIAIIVAKILVPLILIVVGSITFFQAIISDDADALEKATRKFIFSILISIFIFFIPTFVNTIIGLVSSGTHGFDNCQTCLFKSSSECDKLLQMGLGD